MFRVVNILLLQCRFLLNVIKCTRPVSKQRLRYILTSKRYLSHGTHCSFIWSHLGKENISPPSRSPFLHSTPSLLANHVTRISRTRCLPLFGIPRAKSVRSIARKFDLRDPLFRGGRLVSLQLNQLNQKGSGSTAPTHFPPFFSWPFSCFALALLTLSLLHYYTH